MYAVESEQHRVDENKTSSSGQWYDGLVGRGGGGGLPLYL